MEKQERKPDEIDSYEYLSEHLWDRAHRGGFADEFETLKTVLPRLKRFRNLSELLNKIESGVPAWRHRLGTDLVRLYQKRTDLRPATFTMLILVCWLDLTELYETLSKLSYDQEPFAEIYWTIFEILNQPVACRQRRPCRDSTDLPQAGGDPPRRDVGVQTRLRRDAPKTLTALLKQLRERFIGEVTVEEDELKGLMISD